MYGVCGVSKIATFPPRRPTPPAIDQTLRFWIHPIHQIHQIH